MATPTKTSTKAKPNSKYRNITSKAKTTFNKHSVIYSILGTLLVIALLIILLFIFRKDIFYAGSVNGRVVTTPVFYSRLVTENGEASFEAVVRETLIEQEAEKQNIVASEEDIDEKLREIEERFGGPEGLQQALEANQTTMGTLREQLKTQVLVEKLFSDQAQVSDEDIAEYTKQNKEITEGLKKEEIREQIASQKVNEVFSEWFEKAREEADIKKFF